MNTISTYIFQHISTNSTKQHQTTGPAFPNRSCTCPVSLAARTGASGCRGCRGLGTGKRWTDPAAVVDLGDVATGSRRI